MSAGGVPEQVRAFVRGLDTHGHTVGRLLPARFDSYVRVLHAAEIAGRRLRWADVFPDVGDRADGGFASFPARAGADPYGPSGLEIGGVIVEDPDTGRLDAPQLTALVSNLGAPDTPCWVAVWEGEGDLDRSRYGRLELPSRVCPLFSVRLGDVALRPWAAPGTDTQPPPTLWWPADESWAVATDVDADYTLLGASSAVIDAVRSDPRLETVEARISDRL